MSIRPLTLVFAFSGWFAWALAALPQQGTNGVGTQSGGQEIDDLLKPPSVRERDQRAEDMQQQLLGAWRLTAFRVRGDVTRSQAYLDGFALFLDGYMAILVQAEDVVDFYVEPFYQAGVHHYRVDPITSRLQTASIVAHQNNGTQITYEIPYTPREFRVDVSPSELSLEKPDGSLLEFRRVVHGAFPEKAKILIEDARGGNGMQIDEDENERNPFKRFRYK